MIVLQIGVCITIGAARLNVTKSGATDASRLIVVVAHVCRRDVTSFKRFQDIIGRILVQYLVAVFASGIQTSFLVPVICSFNYGVLILAVVPALIPDVIKFRSMTLGTWVMHSGPVLATDYLNLAACIIR